MLRQFGMLAIWLCASFAWVMGAPQISSSGTALELLDGDHLRLGNVAIGKYEARFLVQNRTRRPLQVDKVSASCTCMNLDFDKGPMAPGEIRECVVEISVQAGNRKTTAVIFDMAQPSTDRVVKMISFHGVQEDSLEIRVDPPELTLVAGEVREVTLECRWKSQQPIEPDQQIQLKLGRPQGVALLRQEEVTRSENELCYRYTVGLDARALTHISSGLSFQAGQPLRASEEGKLEFPVAPSLDLRPTTLLVDGGALTGEELGSIRMGLAKGWSIDSIEAPNWLGAELVEDQLQVALLDAPPFTRGTGEIEVKAAHTSGRQVTRSLKCILDRRSQ